MLLAAVRLAVPLAVPLVVPAAVDIGLLLGLLGLLRMKPKLSGGWSTSSPKNSFDYLLSAPVQSTGTVITDLITEFSWPGTP